MKYLLLFLLLPCSLYADHLYAKPIKVKYIQSDKIKLYLGTPELANEFKRKNINDIQIRLQDVGSWLLMHEHLSYDTQNNVLKFNLILNIDHTDIKMIAIKDQNVIDSGRTSPAIPKITKFFAQALTGTLNNNMQIRITLPLILKSNNGVKFIKFKVLITTLKNKIFYNTFKFTY